MKDNISDFSIGIGRSYVNVSTDNNSFGGLSEALNMISSKLKSIDVKLGGIW